MWPFASGFLHLPYCLQGLSMLQHVSVFHSFFIAEQHSIVCIYHVLFIHSFIDGHLVCFHFGATFQVHSCTSFCMDICFISLGNILRSEIGGSCGKSMFNILRKCQSFPQVLHQHIHIPTVQEEPSYNFSTSLQAHITACLLLQPSQPSPHFCILILFLSIGSCSVYKYAEIILMIKRHSLDPATPPKLLTTLL